MRQVQAVRGALHHQLAVGHGLVGDGGAANKLMGSPDKLVLDRALGSGTSHVYGRYHLGATIGQAERL